MELADTADSKSVALTRRMGSSPISTTNIGVYVKSVDGVIWVHEAAGSSPATPTIYKNNKGEKKDEV